MRELWANRDKAIREKHNMLIRRQESEMRELSDDFCNIVLSNEVLNELRVFFLGT